MLIYRQLLKARSSVPNTDVHGRDSRASGIRLRFARKGGRKLAPSDWVGCQDLANGTAHRFASGFELRLRKNPIAAARVGMGAWRER